jgi:hypothetical protein
MFKFFYNIFTFTLTTLAISIVIIPILFVALCECGGDWNAFKDRIAGCWMNVYNVLTN